MNSNSKRVKVEDWVRRAVREGLAEAAICNPAQAEFLSANRRWFAQCIVDAAFNGYRLRELQDIMDWKLK